MHIIPRAGEMKPAFHDSKAELINLCLHLNAHLLALEGMDKKRPYEVVGSPVYPASGRSLLIVHHGTLWAATNAQRARRAESVCVRPPVSFPSLSALHRAGIAYRLPFKRNLLVFFH